jgi:4-hydroxy-tetrahydrodipicolinate synthase
MVTPFDSKGNISEKKLKQLVEHLIENATDTIVVAGTTGESPTLSKEEKLYLFEKTAQFAKGRVKIIANAGSNNTKESIDFVQAIEKLHGVDGIMLVNPYYNKPSQEGLYQHFKTIAESTKLPVMLYNIPGRTAVNLNAETTIRLSSISNIVAVKESSGDLSQIAKVIEHTSEDFFVYSGDDNLTLPILSLGGNGVVSVASHIVGNEMKDMIDSYQQGDGSRAASIHRCLLPFFEGIFFTTNPVPVKAILNKKGIEVGSVRLPLVPLNKNEKGYIKVLMDMCETKSK